MSKPVLIGIAFVIAVLGIIIYSSMNLAKYRVEVCVEFNAHQNCRIASADSEEHALRTAMSNACATIASGVTDSLACEHANPLRVTWLKK